MKTKSPFKDYDKHAIDVSSHQSIKLNDDIYAFCKRLFDKTGSEFYTFMLSQGKESMVLSNFPYSAKVMYYKRRLKEIDVTLKVNETDQPVAYPNSYFYKLKNLPTPASLEVVEKEMGIFNYFSLTKACDNYALKLVLSGRKQSNDYQAHYKKNKSILEDLALRVFAWND